LGVDLVFGRFEVAATTTVITVRVEHFVAQLGELPAHRYVTDHRVGVANWDDLSEAIGQLVLQPQPVLHGHFRGHRHEQQRASELNRLDFERDGELPVAGGFRLDLEVDHGPGQADRSGHLGESGVDGVAHGNTELFAERTDLRGGAPV